MRAHAETLLEHTFFLDEVRALKDANFITVEQYRKVALQTPTLKTNRNWLVRIGFFILGCMLYSSISGAVALVALPLGLLENHYQIMFFVNALTGLVASEILARSNFFAHGLDDAFILGFLSMSVLAFGIMTESSSFASVVLAVLGLACCLRYVNAISGLLALLGVTSFFCCLVFDLKVIEQWALPFIGLLLAIAFYMAHHFMSKSPRAYLYQHALKLMQIYSLLLGYASVNYLVVRELSVALMGVEVAPGHDIPFAMVFYILTFALPAAMVLFGLKQHSKPLLIIGILSFFCAILSIRYYYHFIPTEVALLLGGLLLFALSLWAIKQLKRKESGLTFERDRNSNSSLLDAQMLAAIGNVHAADLPAPMPFGGGDFSGGGAGGSY